MSVHLYMIRKLTFFIPAGDDESFVQVVQAIFSTF